ncbi:phosphatidylserine decarboxylase [Alkalicoccus luteus]|uniref:Phosphatidylserine decarboxylase n=1 Tax=Alkalicoccus luteus TaxID=1237094 RepID=A0A969PLR6_9BACI|nr:phosphatidylserine decarboxylase [Alkalicoccus luteus]NJP36530.1 phosphatidylserine decarboxylase [Alkalicoccus luteus]
MNKQLYTAMLELTHNPLYAKVLQSFVRSRASSLLIPGFIKTFQVDMADYLEDPGSYRSLQEFFTRHTLEGTRPVTMLEKTIASPVDGVLTASGSLRGDGHFYVKGVRHSLETMLAVTGAGERYQNGSFAVFYLSPKEYHRIHAPSSGRVLKRWAAGEYSEPVNDMAFLLGRTPLADNYRLMTEMEGEAGRFITAKVGALNVNSVMPSSLQDSFEKGEEMAAFGFGSSVVLLYDRPDVRWKKEAGTFVRQGEAIAVEGQS